MAVKFSNNATTTLSANVSAGATSFSVNSASTFPTLGTGDWCYITLSGSETEVVKVTDIDGTTFTCEALANNYSSGDVVDLRVSAETLDDVYSWADKISVDGTGVDVTGTLTADTLSVDGATTITSGTSVGLTINHDTFKKGLVLHRNHASYNASLVFKNNSGDAGTIHANVSNGNLYYQMGSGTTNHLVWHAGNDGSGSTLDADLLDGVHGSSYLRSDADDTYAGILSLGNAASKIYGSDGNPLVQVRTNRAYFGSINRAVTTLATNSSTGLKANVNGTDYTVWHAGNDGSGSTLDADLLDGQHGSYYYSAGNPPPGSDGGNADTVDNLHASSFLRSDADDSFSHTITGNKLYLGGSQILSSHAALQVNGFQRTGTIYLHEGATAVASNVWPLSTTSGGDLKWNTNKVWHAGNDGSGSGLDADLLDGQQGSYYLDYNNLTNTPSGGGGDDGPAFQAHTHSSGTGPPQSLNNNTWTKANFGHEVVDTDNCFASGRFTPDVAGWYIINCSILVSSTSTTWSNRIRKNSGTSISESTHISTAGNAAALQNSAIVYLNGSSDYVEVDNKQNSGGGIYGPQISFTCYFNGALVRKQ